MANFSNLHGINLNLLDSEEYTALNSAVLQLNLNIVKLLLFYEADPNITSKGSKTALTNACNFLWIIKDPKNPIRIKIIKALANCPTIDIDKTDENGSALHIAIDAASIEAVKILLDAGADTNIKDKDRLTALDYAQKSSSKKESVQIIELLNKENFLSTSEIYELSIPAHITNADDVAKMHLQGYKNRINPNEPIKVVIANERF